MTDPPGAAWRSSSPPRPTAIRDWPPDHLPEIIVGADNVKNLDAALWAYRSRADGGFSQQAEHATGLGDAATTTADAPMYIGRQLRAAARRVTVGSP
jgi:hypothetical protein